MVAADKVASIRAKAEVLAGHSLGDNGDALTELAAQTAMALCSREDIPEDMEAMVAVLTVSLSEGRKAVKAVTRGDTSITYDTEGGLLPSTVRSILAPWRRLGQLAPDIPPESAERRSAGARLKEE